MTEIATPVEQAKHLSADERQAIIEHLREFGTQQAESQQLADRGSLERAAELMRLYRDESWMEELPAPGRRSKVPPHDFRRFTKWAIEDNRLGLERRRIHQLKGADEVVGNLRASRAEIAGATGNAVEPLRWMVNNDYADRMGEVWRDARQLAGGDAPGRDAVKRALSDWKKRNVPKTETSASAQPKGYRAKVRRAEEQIRQLAQEVPTLTIPMLEKVLAEWNAKAAATPPVEEW
jgi:hypothetical protein